MKSIKSIFRNLINWVFPRGIRCIACADELSSNSKYHLCSKCSSQVAFISGKVCKKCGDKIDNMSNYCLDCKSHSFSFHKNVSVMEYKDLAISLTRGLKYENKKYYSYTLSNFMVRAYLNNNYDCDIVIPVPLSEKRYKTRGYNQAERLTQSFPIVLGLRVDTTSLVRVKHTSTQTSLSKTERMDNVKDAFVITDKKNIVGKNILLVDDVYTTGSTLNECAKVLMKGGARQVVCITLAHAKSSHTALEEII